MSTRICGWIFLFSRWTGRDQYDEANLLEQLCVTDVLSHNKLTALWPSGRRTWKPAGFEHVHLPHDGQEFLKSSGDMLIQELDEVSGTKREEAAA